MTKTGLANKEIEAKKDIASKDRSSRENIAEKDRWHKHIDSGISALGKIGGSLIKNDPKWYKRVPEMMDVTFNLPTYLPNASPINGIDQDGEHGERLPMVKTLYYDHVFDSNLSIGTDTYSVFGQGLPASSALNVSAQRYLTELRKHNSRIGEYEAGDLFQVTAGEIGVYEFLLAVKRAVLSVYTFNAYNPELARALVEAQGFSYESIKLHLKDLQKWINLKITEVNTFLTVPADMTYALRKLFLVTSVYKEGTGDNAQYVQLVPIKFPQYSEDDAALEFHDMWDLTSLQPAEGNGEGIDYMMILDIYNNLMGAFLNSSVLTTMIADIRGASIPFITIQEYKYDETLILKPINEVMIQIMNANICPWVGITENGFRGRFPLFKNFDDDMNPLYHIMRDYAAHSGRYVELPQTTLSQDSDGFLYFWSYFKDSDQTGYFHYVVNTGRTTAGLIDRVRFSDDYIKTINKSMINTDVLNFYDCGKITDDMLLEATRLHSKWQLELQPKYASDNVTIANYDSHLHLIASTTEVIVAQCTSYGPSPVSKHGFVNSSGYLGVSNETLDVTNLHGFNYHPLMLALSNYSECDNPSKQGTPEIYPYSTTVLSQWDKVIKYSVRDASPINETCLRSLIFINPPKGFSK